MEEYNNNEINEDDDMDVEDQLIDPTLIYDKLLNDLEDIYILSSQNSTSELFCSSLHRIRKVHFIDMERKHLDYYDEGVIIALDKSLTYYKSQIYTTVKESKKIGKHLLYKLNEFAKCYSRPFEFEIGDEPLAVFDKFDHS